MNLLKTQHSQLSVVFLTSLLGFPLLLSANGRQKKTHTHEGYPSRESYAPGDGFTRRRAPKTDWSCLGKGEEFNFENKEVFVFQDFQVDIYFQEKWIDERLRHNGTKRILVKVGRRTVGYRAPAPVESRQ